MLTVSAPLTHTQSVESAKADDCGSTFGSVSCLSADQALTGDIETWGTLGPGARANKVYPRWVMGHMRMAHAREDGACARTPPRRRADLRQA